MKTTLAKAVALAATMGAAASAHAVNVDPNGLGQVLLYPVYTADNGNYTAIHVTNTTNQTKAVKVRFVEGMNSAEVLDFNLYLSPEDVWTGVIERTATGARLKTSDTSCTVGAIGANGVAFRDFVYAGDSVNGPARARVGHVEVIEMGVIDAANPSSNGAALAAAIKHGANGVPANCGLVTSTFTGASTAWSSATTSALGAPTGGLYGSANIVNVDAGTEVGFDAVAVANFTALQTHSRPGDTLPNLGQADLVAFFPDGSSADYTDGLDTVSSILAKTSIANDYAVGAGLNAQTDWVVTFPTKRSYVNGSAIRAPFTVLWDKKKSEACQPVSIDYWDREELPGFVASDDFSPQPEQEGVSLCYETNIVGFSSNGLDSNLLGGTGYVRREVDLKGHEVGWARIGLATLPGNELSGPGENAASTAGTVTVRGLPVIGFGMTAIQNGDVGGLLSNYAGAWVHKANTKVTFTP